MMPDRRGGRGGVHGEIFGYSRAMRKAPVGTEKLALLAVSVLVFTVTWNGIRVAGGAFGDGFMALAFAAVLAYVLGAKRPPPLPPWLLVAAVGFVLAGLLTIIFPPSIAVVQRSLVAQITIKLQDGATGIATAPSNGGELIKYELGFLLIPLMIAIVATTRERCIALLNLWTAGAIVNAAVGIADFGGLHIAPVPFSDNRSAGLAIQSNYLALTCALAIPMAMLWFGRSRRWTWAGLIGVPLLLGGVYASGSRAGTVAAALAAAATVALVPRLRPGLRYVVPVGGMALVLLLTFTNTGSKILHQLRLGSSSTSTSVSDSQRSLEAHAAWAQIKSRPVEGVGFSVIANAHDIYLELLDAGGAIALASFLVFIGGLLQSARRALQGTMSAEATACAIAIVVWLANGIFDNQLADKYLYVVPGLLVAIAQTTRAQSSERAPERTPVAATPGRAPIHELARSGAVS